MHVHLLVLNFNGRKLLEECLPSVIRAAQLSNHSVRVSVIDNDSRDDSISFLEHHYPEVGIIRRANAGLCSFNHVLASIDEPVAILLNNDIRLHPESIDPLIEPLLESFVDRLHSDADTGLDTHAIEEECFLTAPRCYLMDGTTYEGFKTAIRWRWGLVSASGFFPGCEEGIFTPGWTASAGAVMAVDRKKFLSLGGFDPRYLPGRLEDLDYCFRGYLAGWHALYIPASVAYHVGQATFGKEFGEAGCGQLALRNTLLFQWKNLRTLSARLRHMAGISLRLAADLPRAFYLPRSRRFVTWKALFAALERRRRYSSHVHAAADFSVSRSEHPLAFEPTVSIEPKAARARERDYFARFSPERINRHFKGDDTTHNSSVNSELNTERRETDQPLSPSCLEGSKSRAASSVLVECVAEGTR